MWAIVGLLVGGTAACAVLALVGVVVLQLAAKLVTGDALDSERVYGTTFLSALAMLVLTVALGLAFAGPLGHEADESKQEAYRRMVQGGGPDAWRNEPTATGIEAVLGWGGTGPIHLLVQGMAALLSVFAWIVILKMRHDVELWRGVLIVLVTQVIWAIILAVIGGVWIGIVAL